MQEVQINNFENSLMDCYRVKLKKIFVSATGLALLIGVFYYFSCASYTNNWRSEQKSSLKSSQRLNTRNRKKMASFSASDPVYYDTIVVQHPDLYYRLVHLDLKGAPPKISYLQQMIPLFAKWGANGLLVEYEDMFPYKGELSTLAAADAYSLEDIMMLQKIAKENNMEYIPLIQTFGHFEFVLKHEKFADLREVPQYSQSLCPSRQNSLEIIHLMIDQIMSTHPASKYLHIGADEVYALGKCNICTGRLETEFSGDLQSLFLSHVTAVSRYIKKKYPATVVIMWDDMLRNINVSKMKEWRLGELVEPMVWNYSWDQDFFYHILSLETLNTYASVFNNIWSASAFKGATGVAQYYTDINKHVANHQLWLDVVYKYIPSNVHFRGYALTGWQRYNHFSVLCELLPSAIPSLVICLQTLIHGGFTAQVHREVTSLLGFENLVSMGVDNLSIKNLKFLNEIGDFPGSTVYTDVKTIAYMEYSTESQRLYGNPNSKAEGWLTDYHLQHNISSPGMLEFIQNTSERLRNMYEGISDRLSVTLIEIYGERTATEWMQTRMTPVISKLKELQEKSQQLLNTVHKED